MLNIWSSLIEGTYQWQENALNSKHPSKKSNWKENETIMVFEIFFHESICHLYIKINQELFGFREN